jgi:glycosyltransferase involved in cell wall biosynthesis
MGDPHREFGVSEVSPLVSVVTPCYNAASFVGETIEAVAAQTCPAVEHILVDDGSTDQSWTVIQRYAAQVVAVALEQNCGGSHARNRGAALARGAYLMFLDADDLIAPDAIAALVAAVRDQPLSAGVCPWDRLRQSKGRWVPAPAKIRFPPPKDPLDGWLKGIWVPPCAVLWRRDAYETSGGWDEAVTFNDDGDIMMRALARGVRLVATMEGRAYYRWHGDARLSLSQNLFTKRQLDSERRVLDKMTDELARQGSLQRYATPIGRRYQGLALLGFQDGFPAFARECLQLGLTYAKPHAVSPTLLGRLLDHLLGIEGKERLASGLARRGIMTPGRRRSVRLRSQVQATHD